MIELYATIKKSGPPTKNTPGAVGQIYVDTDTGLRWECVEAHREKHYKGTQEFYDWEERGLDPDFVVGGLEEAESKISLPVKLNVLKTICKNGQIAGTNDKYTFFLEYKLNEGDLYLLDYRYYVNGVEDPANRICAVSSVINDTVCWGSNDSANNITMTKNWVTDTWRPKDNNHKSVINIYQVEKVVEDDSKYHVMTLEGRDCIASGLHAHAEGGATLASGMYSHAEGTNAVASGDHSHAEGFNTEAAGPKQHVEGMYNVIDKEGKYAHIVGNGPDGSSRSNAYTLDWQGNARFAGDVYAGGSVLGKKPKAKYYILKVDDWTEVTFGNEVVAYAAEIKDPDFIGQDSSVYFTCPEMGYIGMVVPDFENGRFVFQLNIRPTADASAMVIKHEVELQRQYLTFSSPNPFTMSVTSPGWDGTIEYSTDGANWTEWHGEEISGTTLYFCGTGNTIISADGQRRWTIKGSNVECFGNIEALLDYKSVALARHPTMGEYCFAYLFSGCTALTTAPELPATRVPKSAYTFMFNNCTSLTTAPELPATVLARACYDDMFRGCTALTTAPKLPATEMVNGCYSNMFYDCTALTTAPALPATVLNETCYNGMFENCTSLITVPALPATKLSLMCYYGMFRGCSKLKFSATQTDEYTQAYRVPTSGTGTTAVSAFESMLAKTGGTFTGNPTINTTYYLHKDCTIV